MYLKMLVSRVQAGWGGTKMLNFSQQTSMANMLKASQTSIHLKMEN